MMEEEEQILIRRKYTVYRNYGRRKRENLIRRKYTVYRNYDRRKRANAHSMEVYSLQKLWWKKNSKCSFDGNIQCTETIVEEKEQINAHLTEIYSPQKLW